MKEKLKGMLTKSRYEHSVGVSETAVKMARFYGADEQKARIAGLLHDCAKKLTADEAAEKCAELGVELDETELLVPELIHAPLGAGIARYEFGITDSEILGAIAAHTVAKEHMSDLEKIIYIADMIEPNREFPNVDECRRVAFEGLDKAFLYMLDRSIVFNVGKGVILHPNTVLARNETVKRVFLKK